NSSSCLEDRSAFGMSPPTTSDWRTGNRLRQIRHRAARSLKHDAVAPHESYGLFRIHGEVSAFFSAHHIRELFRRLRRSRSASTTFAPSDACPFAGPRYRSFLNFSTVRPESRTIPPIVYSLMGLWRGIVRIRLPSLITM